MDKTIVEALLRIKFSNVNNFVLNVNNIKKIDKNDTSIYIAIELNFAVKSEMHEIQMLIEQEIFSVTSLVTKVSISINIKSHKVQQGLIPLKTVKNIIAIASGKGGVGKSSITVNLALALLKEGAKVGILDADIYGPSQPKMLGIMEQKLKTEKGKTLNPIMSRGLQVMSIGFLVDSMTPMIWRGPMVTGALEKLLKDTNWNNIDYLLVDLPPGTGDVQLTLAQKIPVTGAIIVTTPQDIALLDAQKGLKMFEKVNIPIIGIVENMATHICSKCGNEENIFGKDGGLKISKEHNVDLLGRLPLDIDIRKDLDEGIPSVIRDINGKIAKDYKEIAIKTSLKIASLNEDFTNRFPNIIIDKN